MPYIKSIHSTSDIQANSFVGLWRATNNGTRYDCILSSIQSLLCNGRNVTIDDVSHRYVLWDGERGIYDAKTEKITFRTFKIIRHGRYQEVLYFCLKG